MEPNHLIHETSPYLLQHAYNPVEWYAWGDAAFEKARQEDKPILVSIGYAACHWCHVMEHESFEDETTAAFMNAHFVNIKVDREERMDVDHIYMQACQLLTGAGGWPLNMFLTPELKPFTGGTYFPPKPAYGKASWMDVLVYVRDLFSRERDKVEEQAQLLSAHMLKMDNALLRSPDTLAEEEAVFTKADLATVIKQLKDQFDNVDGGFGSAPKFPGSMNLLFLLRSNFFDPDETVKKHIERSLQHMMYGGIFDHAGGGFARYTVDKKWMVPHFEKMLYDNALLVSLYAEAYMVTQNAAYAYVIKKTLAFLEREMRSDAGGFYASYDADSEGVEGKYYTWSWEEAEQIAGADMTFVSALYGITKDGNWEHTNILFRTKTDEQLRNEFGLTQDELEGKIEHINQQLFEARKHRIKPGLDDKIILSWNALLCSAYTRAYKALGDQHYRRVADQLVQFMLTQFSAGKDTLTFTHTYKNGKSKYPAFLEDYATLIRALTDGYMITGDQTYLQKAKELTAHVISQFSDGVMFYFTHEGQPDIPLRSKEFYDHATPSGNSVMMHNLLRLSAFTGDAQYRNHAMEMLAQIKPSLLRYPSSFGNWLCGALSLEYPYAEVVVTGPHAAEITDKINTHYYPHITLHYDATGLRTEPVFEGRFISDTDQIYLCRNSHCRLPVTTVQDFLKQLLEF